MKENEIFEGFDETQYEEEARQRWGSTAAYAESQKRWGSYSADKKKPLKPRGRKLHSAWSARMNG